MVEGSTQSFQHPLIKEYTSNHMKGPTEQKSDMFLNQGIAEVQGIW